MNHKEMTAHIRSRLKYCDIPACCRMLTICGSRVIQVYGVKYESRWTVKQLATIAQIAIANKLTFVRGLPVTETHCCAMTERAYFDFYFWD